MMTLAIKRIPAFKICQKLSEKGYGVRQPCCRAQAWLADSPCRRAGAMAFQTASQIVLNAQQRRLDGLVGRLT
jgi:hypothetical protein